MYISNFCRKYFGDGLFVEVMSHLGVIEYWIGHDDCGIKSLAFGIKPDDIEFESLFDFDFSEYLYDFVENYLDN